MALKIFERLLAFPVDKPRIINLGVDYYLCSFNEYLELRIIGMTGLLRTGRVIVNEEVLHPNVYRIDPYVVDGSIRILTQHGRIAIEEKDDYFFVTNTINGTRRRFYGNDEFVYGKVEIRKLIK